MSNTPQTNYNVRWYDPSLGRLCEASRRGAQADSIIPPGVQGLDRYAYVNNSPLNYLDPSGHLAWIDGEISPYDLDDVLITILGDDATPEFGLMYYWFLPDAQAAP